MRKQYPELHRTLQEYIQQTSETSLTASLYMIEMFRQGMTEQEVISSLREAGNRRKTVWNLKPGDTCYIIKETGEIIETQYKEEEYFSKVRKFGNLVTTRHEAEKVVTEREHRMLHT